MSETVPFDAADLQKMFDASPFISALGLEVLSVTAETLEVEVRMPMIPSLERLPESNQFHGGPIASLIDTIVDRHGRLDVVVNNAGGSPYSPAADASPRFHQKVIELNLLGMLHVSQAANAVMQQQSGGGAIVSVSSVSGRRPSPGTAAYGAAKAGVDSLTATLAVELAPKVRVNAVVAGMVATEQVELFYGDSASQAAVASTIPLGRLAQPADIGWAAAFLASDAASYISGAALAVHGGGEPPPYLSASNANN